MPVVSGLASSHAPFLLCPADQWPKVHRGLAGNVPQPAALGAETQEVIEGYLERSRAAFAEIRQQLERARPDALIIVGDDQDEVFSGALIPHFAMYLGDEIEGTSSISWLGQSNAENRIRMRCNSAVARIALQGLVDHGFDVSFIEKLTPLARPDRGLSHAFTRIARLAGIDALDIPVVILFMNAYHPPLPSAARCLALGRALRDIFADRPERVAIYGSGGLSHDPLGPRAGWVDEPLDRWVLDRIAHGESASFQNLFTFDSDALRGGTGEIRCWLVVAGALEGVKGRIIDYIPSRMALTGLGFAHWPADTE